MNLEEKLVEKSIEAFIVGLEIYNKPTIRYRVEGFSFFICNAWELMLKSYLIKENGSGSIYFKDNTDRTISLENCIKKIFTNKKDPLRINLETIIELRNTSTHFITEEYEQIYAPLFQSCVLNFSNKIFDFHKIDLTEHISQNFLTLSVNLDNIDNSVIEARYPKEIADKFIHLHENISNISKDNNVNFSISLIHEFHLTKNKDAANITFRIAREGEEPALIIKELKDVNETHKYKTKDCIRLINKRIQKEKIPFIYDATNNENKNKLTTHTFGLFTKFYNLKTDERYCYKYHTGKGYLLSYSSATIDFIFNEIKKNPQHIVKDLKNRIKKANPRGKGF